MAIPMHARVIASLTAGVLLGLSAATAAAQGGASKDLTVVSWGGTYTRSQMLAYVNPFRQQAGQWVNMETYNGGLDEIREQVETANVTWDVVDFVLSDLIRACREGLLEKIDHTILPPGIDGTPADQDFIFGAFTECGVGQTVWSNVIAYDGDLLGAAPPSTLADFFNVEKYPGKRGLRREPLANMEWALMADGVPANEVYAVLATEAGQDRAFRVLDRIKPHIVWWSKGSDPVRLLDSKDVIMTSVWNGRMFTPIVEKGQNYGVLWDGQIWDIDSWGIPKGTYNLQKALEFIRFATASEQLAAQTKFISYGPARRSSMPLVEERMLPLLPTASANMSNALQVNADWWATNQAVLAARFEAWIQAGSRGLAGSPR